MEKKILKMIFFEMIFFEMEQFIRLFFFSSFSTYRLIKVSSRSKLFIRINYIYTEKR